MFLLKRTVSPYTGPDLCLGVFRTWPCAMAARERYLEQIARCGDPWEAQAYRDVDPGADVSVQEIAVIGNVTLPEPPATAFVVSACFEGFGQTFRRFIAVHVDRQTAEAHAMATETEESDDMPNWCDVDAYQIDELSAPIQVPER